MFQQVARDGEGELTFEMRALVAELTLKMADFHIINFNSATRGHFSNVNTVLPSLATWSKMFQTDF